MLLGVCLLGIFGASALAMPNLIARRFSYMHSQYRRSDECNICFGGDCLTMDQARCDYYTEADSMLQIEDEDPEGFSNPQLQDDVDNLIFDMVKRATQSGPSMECIPYISRYTDCTKENVCINCQTCHCIEEGRWNCSSVSCHIQDPAIDIDHRVLISVIEALAGAKNLRRRKRLATEHSFKISDSNINLEELSEWEFKAATDGIPAENKEQLNNKRNIEKTPTNDSNIVKDDKTARSLTESDSIPESIHTTEVTAAVLTTDTDYLAFDEVLSNIAIDNKNYTRRKLPMDNEIYNLQNDNKTTEFDYMLLDEETISDKDIPNTTELSYFANEYVVTENPEDEATKIVIDLLESAKKGFFNYTDDIDIEPNKEDLVGFGFDNTNDIIAYDAPIIMKRDVSSVTETPQPPNMTDTTDIQIINITYNENKTEDDKTLKNSVLLPLVKLINSKRNELDELKKIKDNLITLMNHFNQSPIVEIIDYPNISETNILHDIEMFPDLGYDLRRSNSNLMKKFLYKLKLDIYELIKDIIALRRYRQGDLPNDLNILIESLNQYVTNTKHHKKKRTKLNNKRIKSFRRRWDSNSNKCEESTFRECIAKILQTIDRDMPTYNALGPLCRPVKRILRHTIRTYYTDELANLGFKVHDPKYNMTHDLKTIGVKWTDMSTNMVGISPFTALYKIKLTHLYLENDINKINGALSLIDFAHSRRMIPYFTVHNNVIDQINKGLDSVHNKVKMIVQYYANIPKVSEEVNELRFKVYNEDKVTTIQSTVEDSDHRHHKKISFIKHIRNLLKSSKKDISELMERQVPKSEIVKQLARQKLDEIAKKRYNEYEEAMRKWQKNLGVMPRYKRNTKEKLSNRMKNIIPKYLRHKVDPKLHSKKTKNNAKEVNRKKKKNKRAPKKDKRTILETPTTPRKKIIRASAPEDSP